MSKIFTILFISLVFFGKAQDYIVKERFELENYGSEPNLNHRFIYSWGMNQNGSEMDLIDAVGSNYFDVRYQYNSKVYKGVYFVSGYGYNWNAFKLKNDSSILYSDSVFHDKMKYRFQNIMGNLGVRFQSSSDSRKASYFEASIVGELLTRSTYLTWDKIGKSAYKTKLSKLEFANKYQYGLEFRAGYKYVSLFGKYRLSQLFEERLNKSQLPSLTLGIQIDIPSEGGFM